MSDTPPRPDLAIELATTCTQHDMMTGPSITGRLLEHIAILEARVVRLEAAGTGLAAWILRERGPDLSAFEECAAEGCQECAGALAALAAWRAAVGEGQEP